MLLSSSLSPHFFRGIQFSQSLACGDDTAKSRAFSAGAERFIDVGRAPCLTHQRQGDAIYADLAAAAATKDFDDRDGDSAAAAADRRRHPRLLGRQKRNPLPGKILQPTFGRRRLALVPRKGLYAVEGE